MTCKVARRVLNLLHLLQEDNPRCTHPTHLETKSSSADQWLKDKYPNLKDACILPPTFQKYQQKMQWSRILSSMGSNTPESIMKCCQHPLYTSANLVSAEKLHEVLYERVTAFHVDAAQDSLSGPPPGHVSIASPCTSCGGRPKKGQRRTNQLNWSTLGLHWAN